MYFHLAESNPSNVTRALPVNISNAPMRTRLANWPHRDMMKPDITPPTGVATEGIISRAPAVEAESFSTTWKNNGRVKRNCVHVRGSCSPTF